MILPKREPNLLILYFYLEVFFGTAYIL